MHDLCARSAAFQYLNPTSFFIIILETKQLEAGDSEKDRTRYVSHGNRKLKLEEEYFYVYAADSFGSFDKVISTHIKSISSQF